MQARFGATTGAAPAFLGLCKLVLGLLFGSSLLALLQAFPSPLLGERRACPAASAARQVTARAGTRSLLLPSLPSQASAHAHRLPLPPPLQAPC